LGSTGHSLGKDIIFTVSFIVLAKLIASCIPYVSNETELINFGTTKSVLLSWVFLAALFGLIAAAIAAYHLMSPEIGAAPAMILVLISTVILFVGAKFFTRKYFGTRDGKAYLRAYRK